MYTFSKKEAFQTAWTRFKEQPFFLIGLFLIVTVVSVLSGMVLEEVEPATTASYVLNVFDFALQTFIGMGLTLILLRVYDEVDTSYTDLLEPVRLFWKYLAMTILVLVTVMVGFVLFIVPGIIAAIALSFAAYLVIDKGMGPIEAMKESMRMTHGHRWNLFILTLCIIGLNILGFLALGVGLLVTIPLSSLMTVYVYRWLLSPKEEGSVEISWLAKVLSALVVAVVIGGIGIAIVLGVLAMKNSPEVRDAQRTFDIASIEVAAAQYFDTEGVFPVVVVDLVPTYLRVMPLDPQTAEPYIYSQFDGGTDYEACAVLELPEEPLHCVYGLDLDDLGAGADEYVDFNIEDFSEEL